MADFDFEPPTFSLGLDFDLQTEPQQPDSPSDPLSQSAKRTSNAANLRTIREDDDEDFECHGRVSDGPRVLKRLRHGPPNRLTSEAQKEGLEDERCNLNDEIEDFSSEDDCPTGNLPSSSICSSSKPPLRLHGHGVPIAQSGSHLKSIKGKEVPSISISANVETKGKNVIFPKLTVSPLRRFQLIDSDSDDTSATEDTTTEKLHEFSTPMDKRPGSVETSSYSKMGTKEALVKKNQNDDLWKDFCSEKKSHVPTPAFDEICAEYFINVKNKSKVGTGHWDRNSGRGSDVAALDSPPPAHSYFFHEDSRIQNLVRDRLCHFFPLVGGNSQQQNVTVIDYMGQFCQDENSKRKAATSSVEKSTARKKRNVRKPKVDNVPQDSQNWVNPKSSAGVPKTPGSRSAQAVDKSAGHWYTNSSGRKVYVNKNGQELAGRTAFAQYRKESGKGFKNSKKKSTARKKAAAKKK